MTAALMLIFSLLKWDGDEGYETVVCLFRPVGLRQK